MRNCMALVLLAACGHPAARATAAGTGERCPAPKESADICAAVVTYATSPAGVCCMYSSPCTVPFVTRQYSDAACSKN